MVITTSKKAQIARKLRELYGNEALIQEGALRVEQPLNGNKNAYTFELERGTGQAETEIKLTTQDVFAPVCWGLKLAKVPDGAERGTAYLYDYVDLATFAGAGEAAALQAIYNGVISAKSNSNEVFEFLSSLQFQKVPQTQSAAGLTQAETPNGESAPTTLYTNPIFQGSARCKVTLDIPGATPAINPAGSQNYVILFLEGFYVRGADQAVTQAQASANGFVLS